MIKLKSFILSCICLAFLFGVTSCKDSIIYDSEGNCDGVVGVQFVFKKHRDALKSIPGREPDVFYSRVETVHLFVYDETTGNLIFDKTEHTDNLLSHADLDLGTKTEKCIMPMNLKPGKYRFVAWCGLDENDNNNAFHLTDIASKAGDYKECKVKLDDKTGQPVNHEKYGNVFHGVTRNFEIKDNPEINQIVPVELTKNNNDIAVWIQHESVSFTEKDYYVVYTDGNGSMSFHDNSLTDDKKLEYHQYSSSILTSSTQYNEDVVEAGALIAHLSTSRLMESNMETARLEVRNGNGHTVFSIPFIKYMIEMQEETADNQYYLDCEDTYHVSFYLTGGVNPSDDESEKWLPFKIIINNWVKVPDQKEEF